MLNHFAMMAGEKAKDMAVFKREGDGLDLLLFVLWTVLSAPRSMHPISTQNCKV